MKLSTIESYRFLAFLIIVLGGTIHAFNTGHWIIGIVGVIMLLGVSPKL